MPVFAGNNSAWEIESGSVFNADVYKGVLRFTVSTAEG